jgi:curved DNA-binding protein CbpA
VSDPLDLLDYYTLLGVDSSAGAQEIHKAFRKFARRYHPDRFTAGDDPEKRARATQIYRRGSEAYQILTDPVSRRAYDRVLQMGKLRLSTEEKEKADAQVKAAEAPKKKESPIKSPQALAFYNKAADAARNGQWRDAWRSMKTALEIEPANRLLQQRLQQIESRLRTAR